MSSTFDHCKHSQICSPKMVHMCLPGEILVGMDVQILDTTVSPATLIASHTLFSVIEYCHAEKSDINSRFIK